ncbi:MAG: THUMP domain-containing protein [Desulforhabdus sp.]|jgi:tRNA(Ser,Leu) C12 N-acetylase TAN1|nr:THUMP domain-containing protein [Desulforhabdus sp.]
MQDWNVIVTIRESGFKDAVKLLEQFGPVRRTDFFNVLVMKAHDVQEMLQELRKEIIQNPGTLNFISRVVPVTATFNFQSKEELESRAKEIVLQWLPQLAGKKFHVRVHRRGFKGRLSSIDVEHFLDGILLEQLERMGTPGQIDFESPDAILAVETVGQKAGISCWTRADLEAFPFLGLIDS